MIVLLLGASEFVVCVVCLWNVYSFVDVSLFIYVRVNWKVLSCTTSC